MAYADSKKVSPSVTKQALKNAYICRTRRGSTDHSRRILYPPVITVPENMIVEATTAEDT
jgi:hypothetical protein